MTDPPPGSNLYTSLFLYKFEAYIFGQTWIEINVYRNKLRAQTEGPNEKAV